MSIIAGTAVAITGQVLVGELPFNVFDFLFFSPTGLLIGGSVGISVGSLLLLNIANSSNAFTSSLSTLVFAPLAPLPLPVADDDEALAVVLVSAFTRTRLVVGGVCILLAITIFIPLLI